MELRRPKRSNAVNRIWDYLRISNQEFFQTAGDCQVDDISYEIFDFKVFDETESICTNLQSFANNARQFLENFVCLDNDVRPNRSLKKLHMKVDKIEVIFEKIQSKQTVFMQHKFC
jgi:hypothetical protein